jgi:hypothetical protein
MSLTLIKSMAAHRALAGDVVLTGGAQSGCSGSTQRGARRNVYPSFWAVNYQPEADEGSRYTVLNATGKPRMCGCVSRTCLACCIKRSAVALFYAWCAIAACILCSGTMAQRH